MIRTFKYLTTGGFAGLAIALSYSLAAYYLKQEPIDFGAFGLGFLAACLLAFLSIVIHISQAYMRDMDKLPDMD